MNRLERLARQKLLPIVRAQFNELDCPTLDTMLTVDVRYGHPDGGRNAHVTSVVSEAGWLSVRVIIDGEWKEAVWRPGLTVIDGRFVLDVDDDRVAYVNWIKRKTVISPHPYPWATVHHAALERVDGVPHLGERVIGPSQFRGAEFLVEVRAIDMVTTEGNG